MAGIVLALMGRGFIAPSTDRGETWRVVDSYLDDDRYASVAHCADGNGLIVAAGAASSHARPTGVRPGSAAG